MPVQIEAEQAEDRMNVDALEAVGAAGDIRVAVGDLAQDQRDAERHHQTRQIGAAQHQKAGGEAEHRGGEAGGDERDHRFVDEAVFGDEAGEIGADAEERRVPERDDAGIAENEIEREREQSEDRGLGQDEMLGGEQPDARQRDEPERDLERRPPRAVGEEGGDGIGQRVHRSHRAHRDTPRANRPCGRQIKTTIMMV